MVENKEVFNDVLDDGEVILGVMRPNKKKYWAYFNWMFFWSAIWLFFPAIAVPISIIADTGVTGIDILWVILGALGIALAVYIIAYFITRIFGKLSYQKRYYAYSNKRILIRCGIIGIDYKTLDYKLLGATTATVGLLDRMMGGKTGYIRFGSASSPIMGAPSSGLAYGGFVLAHIDLPYEKLKEIKKTINGTQDKDK